MFRALQSTARALGTAICRSRRTTVANVAAVAAADVSRTTPVRMSSGCPFAALHSQTSTTPQTQMTQQTTGVTNVGPCRHASSSASTSTPKGLTPEQTAIIKATVPILETGGVALTTHFYSILMKRPEVAVLFNQTHQASGAQPRALAFSVLSYAKNIDKLENLGPLAERIVQKHVSFQVMPEHYPIVGECLLRAIREVLGPQVATDAVIDAWAAAYQQLADILIAAEAKVYEAIAAAPGGWRGSRDFIVQAKTPESKDGNIVSFDLTPKDGGSVIQYSPGQYIGVVINPGTPSEARRNYSLSRAADAKSLRITVKRHDGGSVSTYLHDSIKVGDTLKVLTPAGEFVLNQSEKPLVLISAGVGITPTISMLQAATAEGSPRRKIAFLHYTQSSSTHAFAQHVESIAQKSGNVSVFTSYTGGSDTPAHPAISLSGRVNKEHLAQVISAVGTPDSVSVYVLGPEGFMKTVKDELISLGVPKEEIKYEFFGPASQI